MRRIFFLLFFGMTYFVIFLLPVNGQPVSRIAKPLPAATPAAGPKFSFGRDWNGCGPADQPTAGIILTTTPPRCSARLLVEPPRYPYITVEYSDGSDKPSPIVVAWVGQKQSATAWRCLKQNECVEAISGTVGYRAGTPGSPSSDFYELKFSDGSEEKGTFSRRFCWRQRVTCW